MTTKDGAARMPNETITVTAVVPVRRWWRWLTHHQQFCRRFSIVKDTASTEKYATISRRIFSHYSLKTSSRHVTYCLLAVAATVCTNSLLS